MPEDELIAQRREKLEHLHALGIEPYPHRFERTHSGEEAAELTPEEGSGPTVTVAGRVTARRGMGKASFLDLLDGSGRLQVYVQETVGADAYQLLKDIDLGDFLGVTGHVFRTKTGEPTVEAHEMTVLAKALRPPPEKWHGLQDVEARYRQRYLDLMSNPKSGRRSRRGRRLFRAFGGSSTSAAISKWRRRCCRGRAGARLRGRSSLITTRWTAISFCASRWNST